MGERGYDRFFATLDVPQTSKNWKTWVIDVQRAGIHLWKAPQPGIQSQSGIL